MEYNYTIKKDTLPEDMEMELVIFSVITLILEEKITIESFRIWLEESVKSNKNLEEEEGDEEVLFLKNSFPSCDIVVRYILDCVQINLKHILEHKESNEYFDSTYKSIRVYNRNPVPSQPTKSIQSNQTKAKASKTKKTISFGSFINSKQPSYQKRGFRDKHSYRKPAINNDHNYPPLSNKHTQHHHKQNVNLIEDDFPTLKKTSTKKKQNIKTELTKEDIEDALSNKKHIDIMIQIYKIILELYPLRMDDMKIFFKTLSCNIFSMDAISLKNDSNVTKIYEMKTQLDAIYFSCHILSYLYPLLKFMDQTDIEYMKNHSAFPVLFPDTCKSLYDQLSSKKNNPFLTKSSNHSTKQSSFTMNGLIKVKGKNGHAENRREKALLDIQKNPRSLSSAAHKLIDEDYEWFSSLLITLLLSTNNTIDHLDLSVEKRHSLNQRFGIHQADHTSTKFDPKSYRPNTNDDLIRLFDPEEIPFFNLFKEFRKWKFVYHIKNRLYLMMIKLIIEPIDNIRNIIEHIQQLIRISKFLALLNVLPFISFKSMDKHHEKYLFDDHKHIEVIEMIQISKEYGMMTLHIPWIVQYIRILSRCKVFRQSDYFQSVLSQLNTIIMDDPEFNLYHPSFNINRFFVYHCIQSLRNEIDNDIQASCHDRTHSHPPLPSLNLQFIKDNIKRNQNKHMDNTSEIIDDVFISTLFKYLDTMKMIVRDLKPNESHHVSNSQPSHRSMKSKSNQPMKKISPIQIGSSFDLDKEIAHWLSFNVEYKIICSYIHRSMTNITIETFAHEIKASILSNLRDSNSVMDSSYTEAITSSTIQKWDETLSSFFIDKIKASFDILTPHCSENFKKLLKMFTIRNTKQSIHKHIHDMVIASVVSSK